MALNTLDSPDTSRLDEDSERTGINVFDNEIIQGIPHGSMIAILADPRGMGELFNFHLVHTDRQTYYISNSRPARAIEADLNAIGDTTANLTTTEVFTTSDSTRDILLKYSARLSEGENIILETATGFNVNSENNDEYIQTLRNLYSNVRENDAIAYLYFANNNIGQLSQSEREVLHMCDGVFNIELDNRGDTIESTLEILKLRGQDHSGKSVKLNANDILTVDTTRDIA